MASGLHAFMCSTVAPPAVFSSHLHSSFAVCVARASGRPQSPNAPQRYHHHTEPRRPQRQPRCRDSLGGRSVPSPIVLSNTATEPDAIIPLPGAATVQLFGVEHCEQQPHIAEHILRTRPAAVVVETALNAAHGAAAGTTLRLDDPGMMLQLQTDFFTRMFFQIGCQLRGEPAPWTTSTWQTVAKQFGGEQLAYIAAFATEAALIFGDRPKDVTFQRLYHHPSLRDIDAAFGHQSALNYQEHLTGAPAIVDWTAATSKPLCAVDSIMLQERDIVMAHTLRDAAVSAGPHATVVGIAGEAHLAGMQQILRQGDWLSASELQALCAAPSAVPRSDAGVRRALIEAFVRISCRPEVSSALNAVLPPISADQQRPYNMTNELYGTCRMLLAALTEAELASVASGYNCDFHDVLGPVRRARLVNGGTGFDEALLEELRLLHFQVQPHED